MPQLKYVSLIDFIKRYPSVSIVVDAYTWIVYSGGEWTTYQRPYNAKITRMLYRGADEAMAIWHAIGDEDEQST